ATAWFMSLKGAPLWMSMFFIGGAVAGIINLVVNFYWKISAHSAGIAGIVAMLLRIMRDGFPEPSTFSWLIAVILLSGLLGAARVWLGRHTVCQVLAGYAVGFCSVFFITLIH
ncbi:MAG: phosphatase PAP2 family protein, partial [Muribaculaceae bacterium]|nr:phosphatase PAP2 family protein [Muribaculaceae bacterium]